MLPYLILFLIPALVALCSTPNMRVRRDGARQLSLDGTAIFFLILLVAMIGFRYDVGGDWSTYLLIFERAQQLDLAAALARPDPGYWLLNVLSNQLGWGITGVNVVGATVFATGTVLFSRSLPRPTLAIACAVPYLVIVVGMGYTRQGIALGFAMIALLMLTRKRYATFMVLALLGATFHKSAVLLLPIAGLSISTKRYITIPLVLGATLLGYWALLADETERLMNTYVTQAMESSGAMIRLAMNAVPGAILLALSHRFIAARSELRLWRLFSWIAIGMFLALFVTNFSTALDRLALYIIPLQMFVFAHMPDAIGAPGRLNLPVVGAILLYYLLVLLTWLLFASHANAWIPFQLGIA